MGSQAKTEAWKAKSIVATIAGNISSYGSLILGLLCELSPGLLGAQRKRCVY